MVSTQLGILYLSNTVIVTTGTFLQGLMHVGLKNTPGGRMGDGASGLSASLRNLGFELKRLKTGTPPRLLKKSIDFSGMDRQHGDRPPRPFSYLADSLRKGPDDIFTLNEWRDGLFHVEQLACAITYTTAATHEIVRSNLDKSPLYCGRIEGVGPRYCPSLEDKVVRFADKERHQLFPRTGGPAIRMSTTSTAAPPACPSRFSWPSSAPFRAWKRPRSCGPDMRSNMTWICGRI